MDIGLDFGELIVLEKEVVRFGNSCHVLVPKDFLGRKVKVVSGKNRVSGKTLKLDLFESEILERKVVGFGTSCHVIVPREYAGKKIKLIIGGKGK